MALTRDQKQLILDELGQIFATAHSVVLVNFRGLTAKQSLTLRQKLAEMQAGFRVVKKTLLGRVLPKLPGGEGAPDVPGEVAVAYGPEPLALVRQLHQFSQATAGTLKFAGGVWAGEWQAGIWLDQLALIPSREVLLARLLAVMQSPARNLLLVLKARSITT